MKNDYEMTMDYELIIQTLTELDNERLEIELDERAARYLDSLDGYPEI